MRMIDELGKEFPTLDLTDIRILLKIYETPGYSIRELAEALKLNEKTVQLKVAVMGRGRKKKSRRATAFRCCGQFAASAAPWS